MKKFRSAMIVRDSDIRGLKDWGNSGPVLENINNRKMPKNTSVISFLLDTEGKDQSPVMFTTPLQQKAGTKSNSGTFTTH